MQPSQVRGFALPVSEFTTANAGVINTANAGCTVDDEQNAFECTDRLIQSSRSDCAHERRRLSFDPYKDDYQVSCIDCFAQGPKAGNERFARRVFWLANPPLSVLTSPALYWPVKVAV